MDKILVRLTLFQIEPGLDETIKKSWDKYYYKDKDGINLILIMHELDAMEHYVDIVTRSHHFESQYVWAKSLNPVMPQDRERLYQLAFYDYLMGK